MTRAGFLKRIGLAMAFVVLPDLPKVSYWHPAEVEELSFGYILWESHTVYSREYMSAVVQAANRQYDRPLLSGLGS